jgi:hypothetical protein
MPHFKPKTIRGVFYDLAHVDPMRFIVNHNDKTFAVKVIFSCHCFTEELDPAIHTPDYHYVHETERRAFSVMRYDLSKQLPALISSLGAGVILPFLMGPDRRTHAANCCFSFMFSF